MTGILLAHPGAFGSGELIKSQDKQNITLMVSSSYEIDKKKLAKACLIFI